MQLDPVAVYAEPSLPVSIMVKGTFNLTEWHMDLLERMRLAEISQGRGRGSDKSALVRRAIEDLALKYGIEGEE
jgi:hypothetical protein